MLVFVTVPDKNNKRLYAVRFLSRIEEGRCRPDGGRVARAFAGATVYRQAKGSPAYQIRKLQRQACIKRRFL